MGPGSRACFQPGSSLVPAWFQLGSSLVPAWFQLGSSLVPAWFHIGSSLVPAWFRLGFAIYGFLNLRSRHGTKPNLRGHPEKNGKQKTLKPGKTRKKNRGHFL